MPSEANSPAPLSHRSSRRPATRLSAVLGLGCLLLGSASPLLAHSRWLVPSHTILSGEESQSVTFDVSVSNDIFHVDRPMGGPTMRRGPLRNAVPTVTAPDGSAHSAELSHFARKSVFDYELGSSGTHRVEIVTPPILLTTWSNGEGQRGGRAFGTRAEVADRIPQGASEIRTRRILSRIVTWVTRNQPTTPEPVGEGLELVGTHPNDLFAQEVLRLGLRVDGRPAPAGTSVKLTAAGTRHRNDREIVEATTGEDGSFEVRLERPGFYLLESDVEISAAGVEGVDSQSYSLFATLEVQPQ